MVNHKQEISKELLMVLDGLLIGGVLYGSYELRISGLIRLDLFNDIPPFNTFYWLLALIIPSCPLILDMNGFYKHPLSQRLDTQMPSIFKSGLWVVLLISFFSIFGRLEVPSRTVLLIFLFSAPIVMLLRVELLRRFLLHRYAQGQFGERSVLVGLCGDNEEFLKGLTETEKTELQIIATVNLEDTTAESVLKIIRQHSAGRVIFSTPESVSNNNLPAICEEEGLDIWIITKSIHGVFGSPIVDSMGNRHVLIFNRGRDFWFHFIKRLMDIVVALVGLLLLSPVILAIAIGLKCTSPGPVIFRQVRSGKRGKRFTMLKFRSMISNAPDLHGELADKNEMEGPVFKIREDPRITPFGRFLRKYSLDEIPQFINVLRGEMSLVGPRPLPDYETERIEHSTHRRRLSVKPGLTCLWQISGRNSIRSFEDWVRLDLAYIDRSSLVLDLIIILKTIPALIFRNSGAH
jgi:exopolysaccharide biosynthesis polyprenyl glycosylphosphotransferase